MKRSTEQGEFLLVSRRALTTKVKEDDGHVLHERMFPSIGEFNNIQDLRTNLLQQRENDVIPHAKKQRRFKEPIPNSRVEYFKEEFHGLSKDEWKKYKDESKENENRRRGELIHVIQAVIEEDSF